MSDIIKILKEAANYAQSLKDYVCTISLETDHFLIRLSRKGLSIVSYCERRVLYSVIDIININPLIEEINQCIKYMCSITNEPLDNPLDKSPKQSKDAYTGGKGDYLKYGDAVFRLNSCSNFSAAAPTDGRGLYLNGAFCFKRTYTDRPATFDNVDFGPVQLLIREIVEAENELGRFLGFPLDPDENGNPVGPNRCVGEHSLITLVKTVIDEYNNLALASKKFFHYENLWIGDVSTTEDKRVKHGKKSQEALEKLKHLIKGYEDRLQVEIPINDENIVPATTNGLSNKGESYTTVDVNGLYVLSKPYIVCAAIKCGNIVITGARHYDLLMRSTMKQIFGDDTSKYPTFEQGFIDQYGKFYDRHEAYKLAKENGQIRKEFATSTIDMLFSEHLY